MTNPDLGEKRIPINNSEKILEKCLKCGAILKDVTEDITKLQFCPICGADLKIKKPAITVHPASFWVRLGAWLLDILFIALIFGLVFNVILNYPFDEHIPVFLENLGERFPNLPAIIVRGFFLNVMTFIYFLVIELSMKGQTLGKLIVGYRKVGRSTLQTRTGFGWILLDCLFKTVYLFLIIDLLAGLVNPGQEKYYRWTQKKEKAVVIKKISPRKVEKKGEANSEGR